MGSNLLEEPDASTFRIEQIHFVASHKIVIVNLYSGVRASNLPDPNRVFCLEFNGREKTSVYMH